MKVQIGNTYTASKWPTIARIFVCAAVCGVRGTDIVDTSYRIDAHPYARQVSDAMCIDGSGLAIPYHHCIPLIPGLRHPATQSVIPLTRSGNAMMSLSRPT